MKEPIERDLTFKLFALELMVTDMLITIHMSMPDPLSDAKTHRDKLHKRLAKTKVPVDEAVSDYIKSGLAAAADKILEEVEDEVARKIGPREHSSERAAVS